MNTILVLMSTYNGEKYLKEQIDSVLSQENVTVSLIIRDDGSKDGTISLIKQMQKEHANIILLTGSNCGCAHSFMALISEALKFEKEFDYYAFCDQDDVWKTNKLQAAIKVLANEPNEKPALYLGAYQMVDENLRLIPTERKHPQLNLTAAFVSNAATGCTMVFNRVLLETVVRKRPEYMIMHDYWLYLVCLAKKGFVYYDENAYILYRQHDHNVIGGKNDSFLKRWSVRWKKMFRAGDKFKSRLAMQLLNCYSEEIDSDDMSFLKQVATCSEWSSRLHLLANRQFRGKTMDENLHLLGLIVTGKL